MEEETRNCPYCGKELRSPYWRHIEATHPDEYRSDKGTWGQLFKDYTNMGMDKDVSLSVISQIFNRSEKEIENYLKKAGVI